MNKVTIDEAQRFDHCRDLTPAKPFRAIDVMTFLSSIGLVVTCEPGAQGFVRGIEIVDGQLRVDPAVATVSDLLHEAGHLAVMPGHLRHFLSGDLAKGLNAALSELDDIEVDSPLSNALLQCSDCEASAWGWAAGKHLGVPEDQIIKDSDYDGDGADIRLALSMGHYLGINGLDRAGLCAANGRSAYLNGRPVFPKMAYWLQPNDLASHTPGQN